MSGSHDEQSALAAAYVLGALDADERRSFESHVASCAECTAEVRSLQPVVAGLALAVPPRTPPAELRARVLAAIRADREGKRADPHRSIAVTIRPYVSHWLPLAAMFVITVGIGAYASRLHVRVLDLEARLEQALIQASNADRSMAEARRVAFQAQQSMAVLAAPDLARIDLRGRGAAPDASARALWSRQNGMVFTASNLPQLPAGRVYQVWVLAGTQPPISAGLITPDESGRGAAFFETPSDIPAPTGVAVTLEPAGGTPAPTGDMYLIGNPVAAP